MTDHTIETSPRLKARIAGALYLISGTLFVRGMPVITGDAAAMAHNILAHETFFRLGCVGRPHIGPVLYRCDASLVRLAKAGEQEPCFARDGLQPRGIHYWGC